MEAGDGNEVEAGPIRVFLVDDDATLRAALRQVIEGETDLEVVGEAAGGLAAQTILPPAHPDVVLIGVHTPRLGAMAPVSWLCRAHPHVRVIILTSQSDGAYREAMSQVGDVDYLLQSVPGPDLVAAIRRAARPH